MGKYKIYGDPISGNCLKVRWTADLLGVSYDWIDVDVLSGYTRSEEFLAINPSGQVPAIVLPDGRSLSQSNAIVLYLASLYDSALVPKDLFERAKVNEWLFWEQYSHEPYIAVRRFQKAYLGKSDSELDPRLLANGKRALAQMSDQLSRTPFLAGENLTVADIALVAYTRVAHEGGFDLDEFPNLRSWVARVESALGVDPVGGAA
ncbi:MAG: glutathione S-transferase family protein [Caulobacterales bacterium]|nr:glutathione S-transferase family protein [Caulobacterales bacterium]HRX39250.1 glutathione S-transferase family protein [Parvularculaceae bacterium]